MSGSTEIEAEQAAVFARLLDPEVLRACIPGCESLELVGERTYETLVHAGVGAVKGRFKGRVSLEQVEAPRGYTLRIEGRSAVGHVRGDAQVSLETVEVRTRVSWDGEARIYGTIASLGSRLLEVAARGVIDRFFANLAGNPATSPDARS